MNIVVEKLQQCAATLKVEIPAEKVQGKRDQIIGTYTAQAKVPGFRPGKAPKAVIEKRYKKEIAEEVKEKLVNEAYDEALEKEKLKVLDFGMPENLSESPDGSLSFEAKLMLAPEVTLPNYKGLAITIPTEDVPQEDIDNQLEGLRERFAEFKDIEGRGAAAGDYAVIDYKSSVEGKPTEEFLGKPVGIIAGQENHWIKLDDESFLPGFSEKVEGMNVGDTREITVTMPEDFPLPELATKEVVFETTLKELKEAELPNLDDELAARLAPGKTLEDITEIIRENMLAERKRKIADLKVDQLVGQLTSQTDFELPEELVNRETQSQADNMVQRGIQSGMSEADIASQQADLFDAAGKQAVNSLRTNFILQEIAIAENLTVPDSDLINHLAMMAQQRKESPKKFIRQMQREGRIQSVRSSLLIGKAIDFLVENAEVTESAEATIES